MSLVQNTNIAALIAQRNLTINSTKLNGAMERLSSGYKINRASDDAAGLTISQNLTSQTVRMQQASRNTQDGIGLLQVADGSLSVINDNLQKVRELTVQAANDTNDPVSRQVISNQIQALLQDVDRIANATNFNGINLLDGSPKPQAYIQVGPDSNPANNIVDIGPALINATSLALNVVGPTTNAAFVNVGAVNLIDNPTSRKFLMDLDNALQNVNTARATIGAYENRLESAASSLDVSVSNFTNANAQIRDTDIAADTSIMTQAQTLTQAATMVLSQTNQLPQMILGLLKQN